MADPDSDSRHGHVPAGLVLAATPLGDSRDASPRLRDALATADVGARAYLTARAASVVAVACEDIADDTDMDVPPDADGA